jgi:2-isopropylmalate synthase
MDVSRKGDFVEAEILFRQGNEETMVCTRGNGSLNAISNALMAYTGKTYELQVYTEHSMQGKGSESVAAAYIGIMDDKKKKLFWGVGTHTDILHAGADALLCPYNNMNKEM